MADQSRWGTLDEIGATGLSVQAGAIYDDFLREMRGKSAYKRYDEMRRNCAVAGAMLSAIETAVRTCKWNFNSIEGEDDPRLEFCQTSLDGMSTGLNDHISEVLTMLPFGYALFEIVYKRNENGLVWRKFGIRGQDTIEGWEFDDEGGLSGAWQMKYSKNLYEKVFLPIQKCILYRTRVERNNPEGRSIFRTAWINYYHLRNYMQIEGIGVERDLAGMPVITMPAGATTGEDNTSSDEYKAAKIVRNIRRDEQEGIVLPNGWELALLSTGGQRQIDIDKIIGRCESRILMSALSQFLLLGQDRVGTYSLSKDQTDFFNMSVNYVADIIGDTIGKYAIPRLLELNGLDPKGITFSHTPVGDIDLNYLADFLQKIGSTCLTWTSDDEVWLRDVAKLPEMTVEELDEAKQVKREQQMEMFAQKAAANPNPFEKQKEEEKVRPDEHSAQVEFFEMGNPPDDVRRRYWERAYKSAVNKFFGEQKKRVVKGARKIIGGNRL